MELKKIASLVSRGSYNNLIQVSTLMTFWAPQGPHNTSTVS